jgi:hypothetical protein
VINNSGNINIGNNVNIDKSRINNINNNRTNNIYKDGRVKDKISTRPSTNDRKFKSSQAVDKANNVLADRDGNVVRKDNDKWQSMSDGKWRDIKTNDASRDQARDRATDFAKDSNISRDTIKNSNISRPNNVTRPSSTNSSNIKSRASNTNHSNFNRNSMNRQLNARSRGSFSGGARGGMRR